MPLKNVSIIGTGIYHPENAIDNQPWLKKIYMIIPKSPTSHIQLKKIAKETNFTEIFIKDISEIA